MDSSPARCRTRPSDSLRVYSTTLNNFFNRSAKEFRATGRPSLRLLTEIRNCRGCDQKQERWDSFACRGGTWIIWSSDYWPSTTRWSCRDTFSGRPIIFGLDLEWMPPYFKKD